MIQKIFELVALAIFDEGKRLVEIKSLTFYLELLRASRKVAIAFYMAVLAFIIMTTGLFISLVEITNQLTEFGNFIFSFPLLFGLSLIAIGALGVHWGLNEKRWLDAFGVTKQLDRMASSEAVLQPEDKDKQTIEELHSLIDKLIEERLEKVVEKRVASEESPAA